MRIYIFQLLFFVSSGVKAKQQKKSPAGKDLLLSGVLFSLIILVKVRSTKKETPLAGARFSSKFCYKVTLRIIRFKSTKQSGTA